jgi:acyl carrier protein
MISARETIERVTAMIAEILVLNEEDVQPWSKLVEDLDADSIAFLELTYRLRKDFGLEVPEAKIDEETLRLPLLDGIDRVKQRIRGTTLFEFMELEALRDDGQDAESRARMLVVLRENLLRPDFAEALTAAASETPDAKGVAHAAALFLHQARETPELAMALDELRTRHPSLAGVFATLEAQASAEIAQGGPQSHQSLFELWREVAGPGRSREQLAQIKIQQLSDLMSSALPRGYDPEASIASLQFRDLFRFITVEAYVRYVLRLSVAQDEGHELGGEEAVNAEIAAWVRARESGQCVRSR